MQKMGMILKTHNPISGTWDNIYVRQCITPGLWFIIYDKDDHDSVATRCMFNKDEILIVFEVIEEKKEEIKRIEVTHNDIRIIR